MITSNYEYIAELFLDTNTGLYDLYLTTYSGDIIVLNFKTFPCQRKHAGRLDLVAGDIYNNTKWTGSLGQINDMLNPFSVREGDIIFYLPESDLQGLLRIPNNVAQAVGAAKNDLIKALKKKKPDGLRRNYLNNRGDDKLPPTVLPDTVPQAVINNNKIKIAPNLFTNPNTEPATVDNTSPIPNAPASPAASEDDIQRILVRRYIKLANG
ncbi:MAG: hypothetical protein RLZZ546_674 [Bacteroidota bacterium]|jgi:hypothetical protein